jgi:hypothetical protein
MHCGSDFGEVVSRRGLLPIYSLVMLSVIESVEDLIPDELLEMLEVFSAGARREMGHNDR